MQQELDFSKPLLTFDGADFKASRDAQRLSNQFRIIFDLVKDGRWRTLADIERATGFPQASISAQLRHSRKLRFGNHSVNKRYLGNGLYEYQLIENRKLF